MLGAVGDGEGMVRHQQREEAKGAIAAWLEWHALAGVDCCLLEPGSRARCMPPAERAQLIPTPGPAARQGGEPGRAPAPGMDARRIAGSCRTIADIARALEAFEGCPLKATANRLCLYDGNPEARLMLVGEAPGAEEDRLGKPFVGPSGRLLDRMLAWVGLDRSQVYITNVIFWRPPGNRPPTASELAACLPFLERQIALVAPELLLFLGGLAARTLLGLQEGVTRLRGREFLYRNSDLERGVPAYVTYHPAYLLRQPAQKRFFWRDLLQVAARLGLDPRPPHPAP